MLGGCDNLAHYSSASQEFSFNVGGHCHLANWGISCFIVQRVTGEGRMENCTGD